MKNSIFIITVGIIIVLIIGFCTNQSPNSMNYKPGQIVQEKEIESLGVDYFFSSRPISDEIFNIINGKSFKKECTTPRDSLKYILCLHRDANGNAIVGEMIVSNIIAEKMIQILKELFLASYPIEKMRLIDYWNADDELSMSDNNSSAFNFRVISFSNKLSYHALGLAVDINPLYNPYYKILEDGTEIIQPSNSRKYLDRSIDNPYYINKGDLCYRLFIQNGFEWGGDWDKKKDYQHFEYHH